MVLERGKKSEAATREEEELFVWWGGKGDLHFIRRYPTGFYTLCANLKTESCVATCWLPGKRAVFCWGPLPKSLTFLTQFISLGRKYTPLSGSSYIVSGVALGSPSLQGV